MLSFLACVIFVPWWERTSLAGPVLPEQERRETLGFCLLLLYGAGWGGVQAVTVLPEVGAAWWASWVAAARSSCYCRCSDLLGLSCPC